MAIHLEKYWRDPEHIRHRVDRRREAFNDARHPTDIDEHVGQAIRSLRKEAKLTQAKFGSLINRGLGWVRKAERGETPISVTMVGRAAFALDRHPIEFFLGIEGFETDALAERIANRKVS